MRTDIFIRTPEADADTPWVKICTFSGFMGNAMAWFERDPRCEIGTTAVFIEYDVEGIHKVRTFEAKPASGVRLERT